MGRRPPWLGRLNDGQIRTRLQKERAEEAKWTKLSPLPALVGGVAMAVVLYFLNAPPFLIAASTALIIGVRIWGRR